MDRVGQSIVDRLLERAEESEVAGRWQQVMLGRDPEPGILLMSRRERAALLAHPDVLNVVSRDHRTAFGRVIVIEEAT